MLDRVEERRRAPQLARHYRDQEGLAIAEIARRLGRAEATIKTYLYDPTGDKARQVKARYRGVSRLRGAHRPTERQGDAYAYCKRCHPGAIAPEWTRERVREAMRAWRARYGAAPSSYDWTRTTHAGAAAKRSNDYKPENGQRRPRSSICTGPGRRPAATPSTVPERLGLNAVDTRTLAFAWSSVNGAPKISPQTLRPFVCTAAATRASAAVAAGPGERRRRALASAADRAASKHIDDSRTRRKAGALADATSRSGRRRRRETRDWRGAGPSLPGRPRPAQP
jgi:hypothetical protein